MILLLLISHGLTSLILVQLCNFLDGQYFGLLWRPIQFYKDFTVICPCWLYQALFLQNSCLSGDICIFLCQMIIKIDIYSSQLFSLFQLLRFLFFCSQSILLWQVSHFYFLGVTLYSLWWNRGMRVSRWSSKGQLPRATWRTSRDLGIGHQAL